MSRNVLFVESSPNRYGSSISLLALLDDIDRAVYRPSVAIHFKNPLIEDLLARNVPCLPLSIPDWSIHPSLKHRVASDRAERTGAAGAGVWEGVRALRDRIQYAGVVRDLKRFIRKQRIDLLHANNQPAANRFVYLAAGTLPVVQHVRSAPLTGSRMSRRLARRARNIVCISEFVARSARQDLQATAQQIALVPDPVPDRFFDPAPKPRLRRMLGLEPRDIVFAQIGRFIPLKGQDLFLDALLTARSADRDGLQPVKVVFIGSSTVDSSFEQQLRSKAAESGLAGCVYFVPYVRDIMELLPDVDVLVHYTRGTEGFGRVVVEAMAAGCAVLVSDKGPLPELVEDGISGVVARSTDALAREIGSLSRDPARIALLKGAARRAAERYRGAPIARQIQTIYDGALTA